MMLTRKKSLVYIPTVGLRFPKISVVCSKSRDRPKSEVNTKEEFLRSERY
jgi:hypothetical protein